MLVNEYNQSVHYGHQPVWFKVASSRSGLRGFGFLQHWHLLNVAGWEMARRPVESAKPPAVVLLGVNVQKVSWETRTWMLLDYFPHAGYFRWFATRLLSESAHHPGQMWSCTGPCKSLCCTSLPCFDLVDFNTSCLIIFTFCIKINLCINGLPCFLSSLLWGDSPFVALSGSAGETSCLVAAADLTSLSVAFGKASADFWLPNWTGPL